MQVTICLGPILCHSSHLWSGSFDKIAPWGEKHHIRIVRVNRRGYCGSTNYTEAELADLNTGRKEFLERIGFDMANFLTWFVDTHHIPKSSADGRCGGIVLMGWSIGTATALTLLGQPDSLPKEAAIKIEPYLRTVIIYGSQPLLGYLLISVTPFR
jgi:pimeloyl-ACP methyl ester carboxylesterase